MLQRLCDDWLVPLFTLSSSLNELGTYFTFWVLLCSLGPRALSCLWSPLGMFDQLNPVSPRNMVDGVLFSRFSRISVRPHGLYPTRHLCPWDSPGKNTGVGYHALLQGIFPTQRLNPGLLHCRQIPCYLSHQGSPRWRLKVCKASWTFANSRVSSASLSLNYFSIILFFFSTQQEAFEFHSSHPSVLFLLCIFYYYAYHPLLFDKVTSPLPCEEEHASNFRNSRSKACLSNLSRNGEVFLQQIDFFSLSTENFKCYWSLLWNSGCVLNL